MNYLEALKIYNKGQNSWCSPRKGTPEYYMVKSIMNKNSGNSLNSTESIKKLSQVISKNTPIAKYSSTSSSSSIKLPDKRILPIKKEKRFPNRTSTSSSTSIKLPKKRILPIKKEKRFLNRTSTSSSSSSTIII